MRVAGWRGWGAGGGGGGQQSDSYLNPGPRACLSNWPRGSPKWVCTIQQLFANIAHDQLQSSEYRFIVLLSEMNFSDDAGLSTAGTDRTPTSGLGRQMTLSTRLFLYFNLNIYRQRKKWSTMNITCTPPGTAHAGRQKGRQAYRQKGRHIYTDRQTERQTDRQTERKTDRQRQSQTDRQKGRHIDRQADRQSLQTCRQ